MLKDTNESAKRKAAEKGKKDSPPKGKKDSPPKGKKSSPQKSTEAQEVVEDPLEVLPTPLRSASWIEEQNFCSRPELVALTEMAEKTLRGEEMAFAMRNVILNFCRKEEPPLKEERRLLGCAFKTAVESRRMAWKVVTNIQHRIEGTGSREQQTSEYREKIALEIQTLCEMVLNFLEGILVPFAVDDDDKVFYYKMQGDYNRYLAEIHVDEERAKYVKKAQIVYGNAHELALRKLDPTNLTRMGLMLNYAIFLHDLCSDTTAAIEMVQKAFSDGIQEIEDFRKPENREITLTLQLLRDNLTLWTSEREEDAIFNDDVEEEAE